MTTKEQYERDGFLLVDTGLPEETLLAARSATGPLQPKRYHWNPLGKRVFEGWRESQAVRDVAWAEPVLAAIREAYGLDANPKPAQTINFDRPSLQKLHQDSVHFETWPRTGRMVGVWVALEDVDESNGTLCYVPGTHRLPRMDWQEMGFEKCAVDAQYEQYARYEEKMESLGLLFGGKKPVVAKMGQAFVWGLEMLHGGWPECDQRRTRYSQVTHYFLPDVERGWAPMFSDAGKGDYLWKSTRWFDRAGQRHEMSRNRAKV